MAEKLTPAVKPVPRGDGFKKPSSHSTITTPNDNEGVVWKKGDDTGSIFGKK